MKLNKTTFILGILILFFVMISSASSASFYVNQNTTHDNIMDWIDNKAVKGDKLIFNTDNYNLTDTIVINKPIYVGSYKNTEINYYKNNSDIFLINTSATNFIGLTLNHYGTRVISDGDTTHYRGTGTNSVIGSGNYNTIKCNIKNTIITSQHTGITLRLWIGNIINSKITVQNDAIFTSRWKGHVVNSQIKAGDRGIMDAFFNDWDYAELKWVGSIKNSQITARRYAIYTDYWKGNIINSKIYSFGTNKTPTIGLIQSKITLHKSIIKSNSYTAILGKKYKTKIKNYKSKLIPKKGYPKYYLKK